MSIMENLITQLNFDIHNLAMKSDTIQIETERLKKMKVETMKNINKFESSLNNSIYNDATRRIYSGILSKIKDNVSKILSTNIIKKLFEFENTNKRKCRYHNRGFCKFGDQCHFQHHSSICEEYKNNGQCERQDCHSRHPKLCRHWAKKPDGCKRNEKCQYLHDEKKKYKSTTNNLTNSIDKQDITENSGILNQSNDNTSDDDITVHSKQAVETDTNVRNRNNTKDEKANKISVKEDLKLSIKKSLLNNDYEPYSYKTNDLSEENSTNANNCDSPNSTKVIVKQIVDSPETKKNSNLQLQNSDKIHDSVDTIRPPDKNVSQKASSNDPEYNYNCKECDFKAISKVHLNSHTTFAHSIVIKDIYKAKQNVKSNTEFTCDKCAYKAGSTTGLEAHIAFTH